MTDTLTTLRAALDALCSSKGRIDKHHEHERAIINLRTLIAAMEAEKPVLYQYRWLNPANNPDDVGLMDWKLLEPRNPYMGTVQDRIDELEAYRYEGKVVYEVRALYARPSEPAYTDSTPRLNVGNSAFERWFQAQPFATQTGVKQMCRDSYAAGMGDPLVTYAAQPSEPKATESQVISFCNDRLAGLRKELQEAAYAQPSEPKAEPAHTVNDDYQHFLSYLGLHDTPELKLAYEHGASKGEKE